MNKGKIIKYSFTSKDNIIVEEIVRKNANTITERSLRELEKKINKLKIVKVSEKIRASYRQVRLFTNIL